MKALPLFVRKFVVDAVETAGALVFALNIALPGSVADAKAAALVIAAALVAASISAARRELPDAIAWLRDQLGVAA